MFREGGLLLSWHRPGIARRLGRYHPPSIYLHCLQNQSISLLHFLSVSVPNTIATLPILPNGPSNRATSLLTGKSMPYRSRDRMGIHTNRPKRVGRHCCTVSPPCPSCCLGPVCLPPYLPSLHSPSSICITAQMQPSEGGAQCTSYPRRHTPIHATNAHAMRN